MFYNNSEVNISLKIHLYYFHENGISIQTDRFKNNIISNITLKKQISATNQVFLLTVFALSHKLHIKLQYQGSN